MDLILFIENQSPFIQSLIASVVFGVSVWLSRAILKRASRGGAAILKTYQRDILVKHWLHRHYVNSDDQYRFTLGFNFVILQSLRWMIRGALTLIFFYSIKAILAGDWLSVISAWLVFNCFLEAGQWVKDSSHESMIEEFDDDLKKEFFDSLPEAHKESAKHIGGHG